jgi:hypothetical protein
MFDFVEVIERGEHSTYMLLMRPDEARRSACPLEMIWVRTAATIKSRTAAVSFIPVRARRESPDSIRPVSV